jgi:hypothetical protein
MADLNDGSRTRKPGPAEGGEGEPEPQGVVETLREEIEEVVEDVVEHVPQPVRWTVGKLARLASLAALGLFVLGVISAVLFFMNRTELVARELSILLNRTLREHSDLVLDLRDIRGNPFTGFRAVEPHVRFRDGATLLAAREMRVDYSAWALMFGKSGQIELTLEHPDVRLVSANGQWRLPVWRSDPSRKGHQTPRELQIRLRVRDATVEAPAPYGRANGVALDAIANLGRTTRVRLEHMTWAVGPWGSKLDGLTADLSADSSGVRARLGDLHTADLELNAEAGWRAGETERDVHVVVGRVRWRWLARVFDNRSFDVPGEGAFVLDARGAREWNGRFESTLEWDGLSAEGAGRAHWRGNELLLDSLAATSGAGQLLGTLRWSKAGWEIGGDARHADPAHWHALHLDGWPKGDLNGRFHYAVDTHGRPSGVLEAALVSSEWVGWRADSALVRVDFPATAPDSFRVSGVRRGGRFFLRGRSEPEGGWSGPYSIRELPLEEWPDGAASGLKGVLERGEGTVESRAGNLYVTGELNGRGTTWAAAKFSQWTLAGVRGRLLPTPDLTAQVTAADGSFLGIHLDHAASPLALGDQVVRFPSLSAQAGDTTIALAGQAAWRESSWWMTISSAEITSDQFHFTAEPPVRLSGDPTGVLFERLAANDHDAHVEARGRWASPGGPYDFEFTGQRLDLARIGFPVDWGLGGRADLRLAVHGRSGDPRWRFEGRAGRPAFNGHVADSLSFVLSGSPNKVELEDGRFGLSDGSLRAAAAVERTVAPFPDSLSATALVRWLKDAASWRGEATADRLPVAPFLSLAQGAQGWNGRASGHLTLSGSPEHPAADVDVHADGFGWRDIRAERVELTGHFADGWFVVPKLTARMQDVESSASVRLPLQLALGTPASVPDLPIQGQVDIPSGDLRILPLIVPQLQSARGQFKLQARLGGTPRAIQLAGTGQIRDGTVRPINRSEVFTNLNADLHFDQTHITLDTLTATQGHTGRVMADGQVLLQRGGLDSYRFALSVRDVAAAEEGLYAVLFDGDFVVSDGPRIGGEVLPAVDGQAILKRGVVEFDFANQSEVEKRAATTQPLYWTYRLQLEATNNLRWHTEGAGASADIEFDADLDLQQTADSLQIYGEMKALRGTYWFLSTRFKIDDAKLTFDNQQGVDPLLDVTAEAKVRSSADPKSSAQQTITAKINGRSSQPTISLTSSEAGADQKDILTALTVGAGGSQALISSAKDPLDNYFTRQINSQLSAGLSEFFAGTITDWELQRDQGGLLTGEGALVVGMGSQVTDKLALRYQQRVTGTERTVTGTASRLDTSDLFEQNVEAEFRVNRFIYLTSGVSRRRVASTALAPATDYNVNLKARWEY